MLALVERPSPATSRPRCDQPDFVSLPRKNVEEELWARVGVLCRVNVMTTLENYPPYRVWHSKDACGCVNGGDDAGAAAARRRFWGTEHSANEFASVRRPSERVTLNLSGTTFITTRDTLARNPHTYFAAMLRMQSPTTPGSAGAGTRSTSISSVGGEEDPTVPGGGGSSTSSPSSASSDGVEFFIDRDPTHFRFILNYLRDSYIGLDSFGKEDLHFLEELSHEAQFFNIAGLCSDISRRMSDIARQHREGPSGDKDFRLVQCATGQIQDIFHEWVIEKNYEFECMQIVDETAYIVLGRRVSRGELALVERLMKT